MFSDLVFCWFASVYAAVGVLVARILGKKSIVVVGGVDVAREPALNYGIWLSPWKAKLVGWALQKADYVLPVDQSLEDELGLRISRPMRNLRTVPTGYDTSFWKPAGRKEQLVLTVAVVLDEKRARLKGIDTLIEAARRLQHLKFIVVGVIEDVIRKLNPPANMTFSPPVRRNELLPLYQRAKVYCQPSRREGLSNTLCEAMLCGCIPVATNVGGTARAVGDSGTLVRPDSPEELASAVERAMSFGEDTGARARDRIATLFPKEKREQELLRIIAELTS